MYIPTDNTANTTSETWWDQLGQYGPGGEYWQQPSTTSKVKQTCDSVQQVLDNPEKFFEGMAKGIMQGVSNNGDSTLHKPSLMDQISHIVTNGVSKVSAVALEVLFKHAVTHDLDPDDQNLKDSSLESLKKARDGTQPLKQTAKEIWERVDKYHIIGPGGVNINVKTSTSEDLRSHRETLDGKSSDGASPIHALVCCQESWRTLRDKFNLNSPADTGNSEINSSLSNKKLSAEESEKLNQLEEKTEEMAQNFSRKTLHFTTMVTIDFLFGHNKDSSSYKKFLENGGDIKERYLKQFEGKTIHYWFYKAVYSLILWLIRPIIEPLIKEIVSKSRDFFKNDAKLLDFIEKKVVEMTRFYGRIEKGRKDYLYQNNHEAGTFDEFLEQSIKEYGGKYTEQDLIKIFNEYIVYKFVPRPTIAISGHRIPLISSLLERLIHSLRKFIVKKIIEKTGITEKMLTQGSNSANHAQLALKRLLEQRLTQIIEMIDRSRIKDVNLTLNSKLEIEAKKTEIILRRPRLHLAIQEHSQKLLRFIDIEACNGDERKLSNLDNRVSHFLHQMFKAAADIVKWEPLSLGQVLENASTNIMETALTSLFENKEEKIETQMQTIFEILDKNFTYIPDDKQAEVEQRFRKESELVDENLNTLQEELARSAVSAALEKNLKNVSGERHKLIKEYIEKERATVVQFTDGIQSRIQKLEMQVSAPNLEHLKIVRESFADAISLIEGYLRYISMQLRSPALEECYSDVQGDLHNMYAVAIATLQKMHEEMEAVALKMDQLQKCEQETIDAQNVNTLLNSLPIDAGREKAKIFIDSVLTLSPLSLQPQIQAVLEKMLSAWERLDSIKQDQVAYTRLIQMKKFPEFEKQLENLADLIYAHRHLKINKVISNNTILNQERRKLFSQIKVLHAQIMRNEDPVIKKSLLLFLKDKNTTSKLYKVFYSYPFLSYSPIFLQLRKIKKDYVSQLENSDQFKGTLEHLNPKTAELEKSEADSKKSIMHLTDSIRHLLEENSYSKIEEIGKHLQEISVHCQKEIKNYIYLIQSLGQHLKVKGCISIGELKLYNTLAPGLIARIAPEITKGTRTLIDATGKPFYTKQFILRLLFLDIARRHQAA